MPKWRKHSIFGTGPRVPLDREQRAQFRARLHMQRRPGRITLAAEKIGRAMLDMLGDDGRLDPAHEHLARLAGVAASTVRRALDRLRQCGFIDWTRRLVRTKAGCEQASNAYILRLPDRDAHFAQPLGSIDSKKDAQEQGSHPDIPAAGFQAALEAVRRRREARLAEVWMARYG